MSHESLQAPQVEIEQEPFSFGSDFVDRVFQALVDLNGVEGASIPRVSPRYLELQKRMITNEKGGITTFFGGPLALSGHNDAWLTPAEVRDSDGFSNFHIIALNCDRGTQLRDAKVIVNLTPERLLKVGSTDDSVFDLYNFFDNQDQSSRILVRPSVTGSLAYPLISTPVDIPSIEVFTNRLRSLSKVLNLELPNLPKLDFSLLDSQRFKLSTEFEHFWLSEPQLIKSRFGTVFAYGVYSLDDPWRYYEIFCFDDLNVLRRQSGIRMRTDSGCDIGMLYADLGCDCHQQLLRALEEAKNHNGMVVHIPTQDGRGYGMNTKIETEAHKNGTPAVFNHRTPAMTTLQVAKRLFGDGFHDIRTYEGVAKALQELGFRDVRVITDNRHKIDQMSEAAPLVNVRRLETNTLDFITDPDLIRHLHDKHESNDYIA